MLDLTGDPPLTLSCLCRRHDGVSPNRESKIVQSVCRQVYDRKLKQANIESRPIMSSESSAKIGVLKPYSPFEYSVARNKSR